MFGPVGGWSVGGSGGGGYSIRMNHHRTIALLVACLGLGVVGCDEGENREAGEAAGEAVGDAVEAIGEGTREATDAVGDAMEEGGRRMQEAADDEPDEDLEIEPDPVD